MAYGFIRFEPEHGFDFDVRKKKKKAIWAKIQYNYIL